MNYDRVKALLGKYGQTQLLDYYAELDEDERQSLLKDISEIDFAVLERLSDGKKEPLGELSPADALTLSDIEKSASEFEKEGVKAIKAGKVGCVLLAGGQGTRLGYDGPKGTFDIGVTKPLYIFECQINNLKAAAERAGAYPHLFIMTSTLNDGQTRSFFEKNACFGYPEDKVHFYIQKTAPAISKQGKILLEEKHKVALTPNGNGGWYGSLKESECGKILREAGIEWLNLYGVDNVLQKPCDPVFVGATIKSGLACGGKVVEKANPEERVGVLCKENGLPAIVEYYEMPADKNYERCADGTLKYRFGVILNYLFSVKKLDERLGDNLPYHLALKKVACIENGRKVVPAEPNGYKLETLAVDIVKLMGGCLGFEVAREREFAPVKNKTGADSVDTARELLKLNGIII